MSGDQAYEYAVRWQWRAEAPPRIDRFTNEDEAQFAFADLSMPGMKIHRVELVRRPVAPWEPVDSASPEATR